MARSTYFDLGRSADACPGSESGYAQRFQCGNIVKRLIWTRMFPLTQIFPHSRPCSSGQTKWATVGRSTPTIDGCITTFMGKYLMCRQAVWLDSSTVSIYGTSSSKKTQRANASRVTDHPLSPGRAVRFAQRYTRAQNRRRRRDCLPSNSRLFPQNGHHGSCCVSFLCIFLSPRWLTGW